MTSHSTIVVYGLLGMGRTTTAEALRMANPSASIVEIEARTAGDARDQFGREADAVFVPALHIISGLAERIDAPDA